MIIYVDDLIILASNVDSLKRLKAKLEQEFEISDLSELHLELSLREIGPIAPSP